MCASRPWEVIFGTITFTVCFMSMSMFATSHKICGFNYKCAQDYESVSILVIVDDVIFLMSAFPAFC